MFTLEGILNTDVAVGRLLVMLAIAIGGLAFAYIVAYLCLDTLPFRDGVPDPSEFP
jgi:phage shock protein PspC (stress-responsive transcriptional regulator)